MVCQKIKIIAEEGSFLKKSREREINQANSKNHSRRINIFPAKKRKSKDNKQNSTGPKSSILATIWNK